MFYQIEYAALAQILAMTDMLKIANKENTYVHNEQARRIIETVFDLESLDMDELPHVWKREYLSSEKIDELVDKFLKTLKFNKVEERSYLAENFKSILKSVSIARKLEPSSFVLYGVSSDDEDDFENEGLILVDQTKSRAWLVETPYECSKADLCLSPLYCHVMSADLRDQELRAMESLPEGFMDKATQPIAEAYKEQETVDDDYVLTRTYEPLVTIRDGILSPKKSIDRMTLNPAWFWYMTGFPGLTVFAHWLPEALHSHMNNEEIDFDELSGGREYCVSSIVMGVGFILYCLALRGFIKLPANATAFEAQMFMSGYDILSVTHLLNGIMASSFPFEDPDYHDFPSFGLAGHNLFSVTGNPVMPVQESLAKTNAVAFLLEAEGIFFVGKDQADLMIPHRNSRDSVLKADFYTIGGQLEGQQRVLIGICDLRLSIPKGIFWMTVTERMKNLTKKELCSILIDASEFGFDEKGILAISDPCHYEVFYDWGNVKRLRQYIPMITGSSAFDRAIRNTQMSDLLSSSVKDKIMELEREWKKLIFSEIGAGLIHNGVDIETNPFNLKNKLERRISEMTEELFSVVGELELKQVLIDSFPDGDDLLSELSYENCRMIDGIYIDDNCHESEIMRMNVLLEPARKWLENY